jgi:hypothetical protein
VRKVLVQIAAAAAVLAIGAGSAFGDGSNGKGQEVVTASCTTAGDVTVYASSGQSAWTNNTHYVVLSFSATYGTFSFTKTFGNKSGFGAAQECTGSATGKSGDTFTFDVVVAPNPNGG